jgi:hypothetical protein
MMYGPHTVHFRDPLNPLGVDSEIARIPRSCSNDHFLMVIERNRKRQYLEDLDDYMSVRLLYERPPFQT